MRKLLVLAVLLGGAVAVSAQTPARQADPDPRFEETLIVSAGLEEASSNALTVPADVIEEKEISARQATSVADLLVTVPGLTVLQSGSAGKVTSLFTRGTESDHTLALWNGVKLNNPFFGGFDWAFLPTEGVRRVEIVRGPFSAIHGGDALGGVVQVLTSAQPGGVLRMEVGERGYGRAAFNAGAHRGTVELETMGHLRRGDGEVDNDFFDSDELAVRARWSPSDEVAVSVVARANESENGIPFSSGIPSPDRRIAWSERQIAVPVTLRRGQWRTEAQVSRVTYDARFSDPEDAFGFTASDTESAAHRVRISTVRREASGSWLAFGSEIEWLEVDDRSVFGVNLDGARQTTRSLFVQTNRDLGSLTLDLGLRHDDNDVFGARTTPKAGFRLSVGERTILRGSWGEGYRAPSIGELFYPFSGNAELAPEESSSWELGIERTTEVWRLGATAFDNRLRNLIDFDFVTFTNHNVGRARTRGIEAFARFSGAKLSASLSGTLMETEDRDTGHPLLRRPEESVSLVLGATPGSWSMSLTGAYVGRRPDVDPGTLERIELPGHARFDVAGRFEKWTAVQPYARIENATDHRYEEVAGFAAPSRRWIVGIAYGWD